MPITAKSSPAVASVRSNGLACWLGRRLEQAEDGLRIAKDVGRADEAAHRPPHREHGHLRADRGRRPFGIRKLLPGADRAERNVVGHDQADRRFDLLDRRAEHRAVDGGRGDRAVDHVVDLVVLEREDLGQPAADFVEHGHGHERLPAVVAGELGGRDGDGIEIVVAELAGASRRGPGCSRNWCRWSPIRARPTSRRARPFRVPRGPSSRTSARRLPRPPTRYSSASRRSTVGAFAPSARAETPQATLSR